MRERLCCCSGGIVVTFQKVFLSNPLGALAFRRSATAEKGDQEEATDALSR